MSNRDAPLVFRVLRVVGLGAVRLVAIVGAVVNAWSPNRLNALVTPPFQPPEADRREDYRP
ncbi:hypothetical protein [Curtobacterium sp. RRHDQ10]|uniref:hypothetical protein n=1 Tax=Curtobacterium phyllosphaerae TaxID=3413379 RepID=UPI003BF02F3D